MIINNRKNKKGQAALEFLLSYGWAILLVMVAIGAIAVIVPNSRSLTRDKCTFPPQMPCTGVRLDNGNLTLSLRNGVGSTINNIAISVASPKTVSCALNKTVFKADEQFIVNCKNSGAGGMDIRSDTKFILNITYIKAQGAYNQTLKGEAYAKYVG